jgi:hypothetical protein
VDSELRAYLERPPPRPLPSARFDERRLAWRLPLGAVIFGGLLFVQVIPDGERAWMYRVLSVITLVLLAYVVERLASAERQRLLRAGTFASARVLSESVERDGEDLNLIVDLSVVDSDNDKDNGDITHAYRSNRRPANATYRLTLTNRWVPQGEKPRFAADAAFPILMNGRHALVFIDDEQIQAARVSDPDAKRRKSGP